LEVKAEYAVEHPDKVVYSNFTHINEKGSEIGRTTIAPRTPDEFILAVESSSPIGFTGILIPKSVFDLVGPFPEHFDYSEDFWWMYKAATMDNVDFIGDQNFLYYKREHDNRLSSRNKDLTTQAVRARKEIEILMKNSKQVPKKIFFYWGNPVMSWLRYMTLHSFRKLNPDWEMELHVSHIDMKDKYWHTPEAQDFHSYKGKNYLPEVEKLGVKIKECPVFVEGAGPSHNSNFFKWNELATNGGIYSDMDILFTRPIDKWYESIKHYKTGLSHEHTGKGIHGGYYSIGFMLSSGENNFFQDLFNFSTKNVNFNSYQGAGVEPLCRMVEEGGCGMKPYHYGLHYIPMDLVYPWRFKSQYDLFINCHTELPAETIGIHWYAGHPTAQEFNNNISPDTLSDYDNTMSYWLKKSL